jgi:hypothetical protein
MSKPQKRKVPPFKMLPVKMREHLGELTGNELKVWLYLHLHTGEEGTAFPSNKTIAAGVGLDPDTVKTCKAGIRRKGWSVRVEQRKRDNGSFSTVVEKTILPWGEISTTDTENPHHGAVVENTVHGKSHQPEVDTKDFEVTATPIQGESSKYVLTDLSKLASEGGVVRSAHDDIVEELTNSQTDKFESSGDEPEQEQNQEQPCENHWATARLKDIWMKRTGKPFTSEEYTLATELIAKEGYNVVEAVLDITLNRREKSAKMVWRRFKVFVDNWDTNFALAKSWHAVGTVKREYPREIPSKFDQTPIKDEQERANLKTYFQEHCKLTDWTMSAEEWRATGASEEHFTAALRFCCDNVRRVTKREFTDLLIEAMELISFEPKAAAAGVGFEVEDAD